MHKICFTISLFEASTCFEHHVLIVRRPKLYYTASGVITLCRWPSRARDGHLQSTKINNISQMHPKEQDVQKQQCVPCDGVRCLQHCGSVFHVTVCGAYSTVVLCSLSTKVQEKLPPVPGEPTCNVTLYLHHSVTVQSVYVAKTRFRNLGTTWRPHL